MVMTERHCVQCAVETPPLNYLAEDELMHEVPGWMIDRIFDHKIRRVFIFKKFVQAIEFINKIAALAEDEGHHPDLFIHYARVTVELQTHAVDGLTENDFIMASKINKLAGELAA